MGCTRSRKLDESFEKSKMIDRQLKKEAVIKANYVKVLYLNNSNNSSKSTILRKMKSLQVEYYLKKNKHDPNREHVAFNTIPDLITILHIMKELNIKFDDPARVKDAECVLRLERPELLDAVQRLWSDSKVRQYLKAPKLRDDVISEDSIKRFEEILPSRFGSLNMKEIQFYLQGFFFQVLNVRRFVENKKWLNIFEDVRAVLFTIDVSEWEQVLLIFFS
jgi:hypothetical protein